MCSKILTPTGQAVRAQRDEYVGKLLAEWALGEPVDEFMRHLPHGKRGKALEPQALAHYRVPDRDPRPRRSASSTGTRTGWPGALPMPWWAHDGRAGIEMPEPWESPHLVAPRPGRRARSRSKHMPQVQFSLWVTKPEVVGLDVVFTRTSRPSCLGSRRIRNGRPRSTRTCPASTTRSGRAARS